MALLARGLPAGAPGWRRGLACRSNAWGVRHAEQAKKVVTFVDDSNETQNSELSSAAA